MVPFSAEIQFVLDTRGREGRCQPAEINYRGNFQLSHKTCTRRRGLRITCPYFGRLLTEHPVLRMINEKLTISYVKFALNNGEGGKGSEVYSRFAT